VEPVGTTAVVATAAKKLIKRMKKLGANFNEGKRESV